MPEARVALRFAARRAAKTGGAVEVLAIVPPQDFVQWGGVQAAIEEEQRLRIEASVAANVGEIVDAAGIKPMIVVRAGRAGRASCAPMSARATTSPRWCSAPRRRAIPGRWSTNFTGHDAGKLPCPVMIIPGSLSDEQLEQLS